MSPIPYESPQNPQADIPSQDGDYGSPPEGQQNARALLLIPAIALMLLASLDVVFQVRATVRAMQDADHARVGPMGVVLGSGIRILLQFTVITGGFMMLRLKSFSITMIAILISIVPVCSPLAFLGIPFGVWALVVLRNPRVQEAFL